MGAINKLIDMVSGFGGNQELDEYEYEEMEEQNSYDRGYEDVDESIYSSRNSRSKVIPMNTAVSSNKMVITQPNCFEDVQEIAESFKTRRSVIINLENVNKEEGRRILDFMYGTAFIVDGTVQKVSNLIYLVTPKNVEIQNNLESTNYKAKSTFSWLR